MAEKVNKAQTAFHYHSLIICRCVICRVTWHREARKRCSLWFYNAICDLFHRLEVKSDTVLPALPVIPQFCLTFRVFTELSNIR